jgi:hypothetical protein
VDDAPWRAIVRRMDGRRIDRVLLMAPEPRDG